MKYIVAVSGGVDSVVLLDMIAGGLLPADGCIVAHFDHGIRSDSRDDALFVEGLARVYGLPFETAREELGKDASEERARLKRYAFLRSLSKKYNAPIVTAHHADDVIESVAINLSRGTGWRGLAVMDSPDIERPLIHMYKLEILEYAGAHRLEWREDSTNSSQKYLRNRIRAKTHQLDKATKEKIVKLRDNQVSLKDSINKELQQLLPVGPFSRYLFIAANLQAGIEMLRHVLIAKTGQGATRPQLEQALVAIKTLKSGKRYEIGGGATLRFTKTDFVIE